MLDREIRECLAVDFHALLGQRVDECRVGHPEWTHGVIDTDIPESAKISLLELSSDIGVLSRLHHRVFRPTKDMIVFEAVPPNFREEGIMALFCHERPFDSRHSFEDKNLERVRQKSTKHPRIRIGNRMSVLVATLGFLALCDETMAPV